MSVVKFKVLCKHVLQQTCGSVVDEEKLAKLFGDGKFDVHETKGVVASLHFILASSARYDVAEDTLMLELQQLGLPKEHTEALVGTFRDGRAQLQTFLAETSLRLPKLEALHWRVTEDAGPARAHSADIQLTLKSQVLPGKEPSRERRIQARLSAETVSLLLAELRAARELCPTDS